MPSLWIFNRLLTAIIFFKEVSREVRFGKQRIWNVNVRRATVRTDICTRKHQAIDDNLNDDQREREIENKENEDDEQTDASED